MNTVAPEPTEPDYRFTLANERTFLAWQRTALGLLAAAVAVMQFLPESGVPALHYFLGGLFGVSATVTAAGGLHRWRRNDYAIRRGLPLPQPRALAGISVILVAVGLVTISAASVLAVSDK